MNSVDGSDARQIVKRFAGSGVVVGVRVGMVVLVTVGVTEWLNGIVYVGVFVSVRVCVGVEVGEYVGVCVGVEDTAGGVVVNNRSVLGRWNGFFSITYTAVNNKVQHKMRIVTNTRILTVDRPGGGRGESKLGSVGIIYFLENRFRMGYSHPKPVFLLPNIDQKWGYIVRLLYMDN
jgi:hypothetical protein